MTYQGSKYRNLVETYFILHKLYHTNILKYTKILGVERKLSAYRALPPNIHCNTPVYMYTIMADI